MGNKKDRCNTCGCLFDDEDGIHHQSLKNQRFLATIENDEVIQECCESCAQECMEAVEDE